MVEQLTFNQLIRVRSSVPLQKKLTRGGEEMNYGDTVVYVDEYGQAHNALITNIFGEVNEDKEIYPSINLIHVVPKSENKTDSYGLQVARATSCVPWKSQSAHGRYYIPVKDGKPIAELNKYSPARWTIAEVS